MAALPKIFMAFNYKDVVPWGRNFDEYRRMFALTEGDLARNVLGCADGPAGFNARMRGMGFRVTSADPLYLLPRRLVECRIDETYDNVMAQTLRNREKFVWRDFESPAELGEVRMEAMREFLADYHQGLREGRYVAAGLPALPFRDGAFGLALCSHYLFLYSDKLSLDFHARSVEEMVRVAGEARLFPLLDYNARPSVHLEPLIERLEGKGLRVEIKKVDYEFQIGGDEMMAVSLGAA